MLYMLIFIYMLLFPITVIAFLWKILDTVEELKQNNAPQPQKTIRKHPAIEKSNYDNAFGGRKAYEIYKNKDGLYEPVTPSRGVQIKKEE